MKTGGAFIGVALVWLLIDRATKTYFEGAYALGQASPADFGPIRFRLVHNTGMAWGLFGDSTFALGVASLIVCAVLLFAWLFWPRLAGHKATMLEAAALALVFSGGLGNAIDRFSQGYVVDFLEFTFIDFPVFNVADIGVTCGFVLAVLGYLIASRDGGDACGTEGANPPAGNGTPASAACADGAKTPQDALAPAPNADCEGGLDKAREESFDAQGGRRHG